MTPSRKRQKPTPADGDTRVVVVVEDRCDSPPANQEALTELPWGPIYESLSSSDSESVIVVDDSILNTPPHHHHEEDEDAIASSSSETVFDDGWTIRTPPHYYDDVDEDAIASSPAHEKENDDNFTYSPASPPPLTQSTHEDKTIPILYVFPDETVVVKADGEHIRIPDQNTKHPMMITQSTSTEDLQSSTIEDPKRSTIEDPKPSTSTKEEEETDARKVCFLEMQNNIADVIVAQWRATAPSTVEEVTVDVCRSLAVTMLSAPYQEILMKYARCAIRRRLRVLDGGRLRGIYEQ